MTANGHIPTVLESAHWYARLKWHSFPLIAKEPATENGWHDATIDARQLVQWFTTGERNIGVACQPSGLVVIDVDTPREKNEMTDGRAELAALVDVLGPLPPTPTSETGSGGLHILFRAPADVVFKKTSLGRAIDVLRNAYIVAPPSLHPNGNHYRWRAGLAPDEVAIAELPPAWLEKMRRKPKAAATSTPSTAAPDLRERRARAYLAKMPPAIAGNHGHDALWAATCAVLVGFDLDTATARRIIVEDYNPRCDPPWSDWEVDHKLEDAEDADLQRGYLLNAESRNSSNTGDDARGGNAPEAKTSEPNAPESDKSKDPPRLTEVGNAERLACRFGDELRYVHTWRKWLHWDGARWKRDEVGVEVVKAKAIARQLYAEAAKAATKASSSVGPLGEVTAESDKAARLAEELVKWARTSSKASAIRAMTTLAQSEKPIAATADMFDRDDWTLNCANGTLDLRTGKLRPHRREDMITLLSPVAYDPDAKAPVWDAFLERVLPDVEVRNFMQRLAGCALTGDVGDEIITFLYGTGANGKSKLTGALQHVLGDYAAQGPPGLLLASDRGTDDGLGRRQRMKLRGRRLVLCQEVDAGRHIGEAQVKQITGGDKITGAELYENETEFSPTHKLIVATNYKPKVKGQDEGIWRRIRLVPFTVTIPKEERDLELAAKLEAEAPGILAWAMRGCLAWQQGGLGEPKAVREATAEYRSDEDRLAEFLDDRTVAQPAAEAAIAALHADYVKWCEPRNEKPWSVSALGDALVERGLTRCKTKVNGRWVRAIAGVRLRTINDL